MVGELQDYANLDSFDLLNWKLKFNSLFSFTKLSLKQGQKYGTPSENWTVTILG